MIIFALAGNRNTDGTFNNRGTNANLWSSSQSGSTAWNRNLNSGNSTVNRNTNTKANGFSVRCVKDWKPPGDEAYLVPGGRMNRTPPNMPDTLLVELFRAYYDARRHKRKTEGATAFETDFEREIFTLHREISERTYRISPSVCFIVFSPVKREIFAGAFRDRVVHHLIFNYLNPLCERIFISDSYSCRKGKGTSYGVKRAQYFVRSCSGNYQRECHVLRLDILGYFMSIDKNILFNQIRRLVEKYSSRIPIDRDLFLWLIRQVVFNDPTEGKIVKGSRSDWVGLPKSKSLFFSGKDRGLPIGNLTSQLFANLYLDGFDHFVMGSLGKGDRYGRYVDDILIVSEDKVKLIALISSLDRHLWKNLGLRLHPRKIHLQSYRKGFSFLGRYIMPYRTYLKKSTKGNVVRKISKRANEYRMIGTPTMAQDVRIEACWHSYEGVFLSCNARRVRNRIADVFIEMLEADGVAKGKSFQGGWRTRLSL